MRILFTGASSFTGMWFARSLCDRGHDVCATMTRSSLGDYDENRRERVQLVVEGAAEIAWGVRFGDDAFLSLLDRGYDCVCHHAADVTDYQSPAFDVNRAVASNTRRLPDVIDRLGSSGGRRIVLTGSVFEGGEGAGSEGLPHFSPYGLSKAVSAEVFRYYCDARDIRLGKFVIPNPFGPFEEPRFTRYLMTRWFAGEPASVRTPDYVRDNIHVDLLACVYTDFVGHLPAEGGFSRCAPSGYVESQGAFAGRVAEAMRSRLALACRLELAEQEEFPEPRIRLNTDPVDANRLGWSEEGAWDAFAEYYAPRIPRAESA